MYMVLTNVLEYVNTLPLLWPETKLKQSLWQESNSIMNPIIIKMPLFKTNIPKQTKRKTRTNFPVQ